MFLQNGGYYYGHESTYFMDGPLRGCTKIMTSLSWGGGRESDKFNYNCIVKFVQKYDRRGSVCWGCQILRDVKFEQSLEP